MKKLFVVLSVVFIVMYMAGTASAYPYEFSDSVVESRWISTSGAGPAWNGWFNLDFPDSPGGTYGNGVFEYDDVISGIEQFTITLHGTNDNSSSNVDIFLDFDADHSGYTHVAGYNVANGADFTLTLEIKNNDLLYNGTDVGDLASVSLGSFIGADQFWVGYGCHFTHEETEVNVAATPETATMILLGTGLLGFVGIRRRTKKSL